MPIITSSDYEPVPDKSPVALLIGPRRGGDWQYPAAERLISEIPDLHVYCTHSDEWEKEISRGEREILIRDQEECTKCYINIISDRIVDKIVNPTQSVVMPGMIMVYCPEEENPDPHHDYAAMTQILIGIILGGINGGSGLPMISKIPKDQLGGIYIGAASGFGRRRALESAVGMFRPLYSKLHTMEADGLKYLRGHMGLQKIAEREKIKAQREADQKMKPKEEA